VGVLSQAVRDVAGDTEGFSGFDEDGRVAEFYAGLAFD